MPIGEFEMPLSLSTACGGQMEEEFQKLYPALLANLKQGDKAAVTITMEFKRVPDTVTMVSLNYRLTPKFPAQSKTSVCQVSGDNRLKTERPPERPKVVALFQGGNASE